MATFWKQGNGNARYSASWLKFQSSTLGSLSFPACYLVCFAFLGEWGVFEKPNPDVSALDLDSLEINSQPHQFAFFLIKLIKVT